MVSVEPSVARLAIEAVKFKVLIEKGQADEPLECGWAHLSDVFELHMVCHEGFDLGGLVVGKTEAAADVLGHADANFDVVVEADPVTSFGGGTERGWLANIMKENTPGECRRNTSGEAFQHEASMNPDIAFGVVLRWLWHTFHSSNFWKEFVKEPGLVEEFEAAASSALGEEFSELFADAFGSDDVDFAGVLANGSQGLWFNCVAETGGETHGAEHAEFVFGETAGGIADGADEPRRQVGLATDVVEDFASVVAHDEAVDGEVTTLDVFFRGFGIDDLIGVAAIGVADIGTEGCDFDFEAFLDEENDAELRANADAMWKDAQHFSWSSVGRNVVIGRLATEKDVAHAAADKERLVSLAL